MKPIVYDLTAPLVDIKTGKIIPPWNNFFQLFTQAPQAAIHVGGAGSLILPGIVSPFEYQVPEKGSLIISGGTVSAVTLARGDTILTIGAATNLCFPVSINDVVTITFSSEPEVWLLPT